MKLLYNATMIMGLILAFPNLLYAGVTEKKLDMYVGEIKVLENIHVERVAIGKGALLKVKKLPKAQLLIIAEAAGSTTMRLWYKDGHEESLSIRISANDPERRLRLEDMIKMDVKIVEFRKSALKTLGINWQKSIDGPSASIVQDFTSNNYFRGAGQTGYFGIASFITSKINYLASNGDAFTLAEPNLSCINGGTAKFLAGGEIPIPVTGNNGQVSITYKNYGIVLEISPLAGADGVISTKIMTEVSQIDPSVSVQNVPGFLTRRTSTQMNVRDKETIVISGMLNSENSTDVDKVPLLGDIPIIGHLFKSTNFRNAQTELTIFVTPTIVSARSQSNRNTIDRFTKRNEKRMEIIKEKLDLGLVD